MTSTSPMEIHFEESIWVRSLHASMLLDDLEIGVVPYRRHREAYELTVKGLPTRTVADALKFPRGRDGVENFIRTVTSTLLMEHEAWLEIMFNNPGREGLPFRVFPVTGVRQTKTGKWIRNTGLPDGPDFWALTQREKSNRPVEVDPKHLVRVHLRTSIPAGSLPKLYRDW